jgi:hypothetical protein
MPITTYRQLAKCWTVWGSNPGGVETPRTRRDSPPGQPRLLYSGYQSFFPGVKRPEHGYNQPPPFSAEVQNEYSYTLFPPLRRQGML